MDINSFISLVSNLGFPIACCIGLGVFVWKINNQNRDDNKEREKCLLENNEKLAMALDKSAEAISNQQKTQIEMSTKLSSIEMKIDNLLQK